MKTSRSAHLDNFDGETIDCNDDDYNEEDDDGKSFHLILRLIFQHC